MSQLTTDYERGSRARPAIAVQIDHTLDRLLALDADREELWPLLYEYRDAAPLPTERIAVALERLAFVAELTWQSAHGARLPKEHR